MRDDDITPASLRQRLATRFVGQRILYRQTVASTMDLAQEEARGGGPEGTVVLAGEQTAGRGRLGRSWFSPRGSLALSVILRPELGQLSRLGMIASLAASRAIERATGLPSRIKWPNDVLVRGKKVCGVLMESSVRGRVVEWVVVGIGINVNVEPGDFPELATPATSLSSELGRPVSRLELLAALLEELEGLYLGIRQGQQVHLDWQKKLETLGQGVRVRWGERVEEGVAEAVDGEGCLLLRRGDGTLALIPAGDVTLRT